MAAAKTTATRFNIGDTLEVDARASLGHCRTPVYVRGKTGVVTAIQGLMHDPARAAYHLSGLPMLTWYKLRFRQTDLWPDYPGKVNDHLELDVQEDWLKPPEGNRR